MMDELELMSRLREEIPLRAADRIEHVVLTAIRHPGARFARGLGIVGRPRLRAGIAVSFALAAGAASVIGVAHVIGGARDRAPAAVEIAWSGRPTAPWPPALPFLGRARTADQLVDLVTHAAALAPGRAPAPQDWVADQVEYAQSSAGSGESLLGPPDERVVSLTWQRVDGCQMALGVSVPAATPPDRTVTSTIRVVQGACPATLEGWKSTAYSYLASLPSSPAGLKSVIMADGLPSMPWDNHSRDVAVFSAIATLFSGEAHGVIVPPKLAATMWRTLRELPDVHFEGAADLAGRTGLGFYMVDGYVKRELVVNPVTYAFMGEEDVAITAHALTGTNGTLHLRKGQVLSWQALLATAIVHAPGQIPADAPQTGS